jgi:nucleoid DNA-binding protein
MATTKKNLIDRIAESTGTKQSLVETVVQQFFEEIIAELAQGNRLEFRDFGVFETKTTPPRMAQNPRTLEKIKVPAKRKVVFRAGRRVREGLNGERINGRATVAPAPQQVNR